LRNSFRKLGSRANVPTTTTASTINNNSKEEVVGIYLQTFAHHWAACQDRLQAYEPLRHTKPQPPNSVKSKKWGFLGAWMEFCGGL
jgi:hypothetical protein